MYRINVSGGKDHFSQRNNEIDPHNACQVTSMVMAASYIPRLWEAFERSPYFGQYSSFPQPEDRFHQAMLDWRMDPTVHGNLMAGFNKWVGFSADFFSTTVPLSQLIDDLRKGLPVVMSGTFPGYPEPLKIPYGHVVCLVGAEWENENDVYDPPSHWIINDPYGDTMNNWKGSGSGVAIPHALFNEWMKVCGDMGMKWAHRFKI